MNLREFLGELKDIASQAVGQALDLTIDELRRELSPEQKADGKTAAAPEKPSSDTQKAAAPASAAKTDAPASSEQSAGSPAAEPETSPSMVPAVQPSALVPALQPVPLKTAEPAAKAAEPKAKSPAENSIKKASAGHSAEHADEMLDMAIARDVLARIRMKTIQPALRLKLTNTVPGLCDSKVGGVPYLPADAAVPCDANGGALRLLAQIDCKALSALPDFPKTGLLQFWIAQDNVWGLDKEKGARVIWHETVDAAVTEAQVQAKLDAAPKPADFDGDFPVHGVFGVEVQAEADCMAACDIRFVPIFTELFNTQTQGEPIAHPDDLGDEIGEMMWEELSGDGHKIGGYPAFTQGDPRDADDARTVLLLQLDSESENGSEKIMWGDCGICNFHCTPAELKAHDFSNVLYYWDCG